MQAEEGAADGQRTVAITGAAGNLGRAVAAALARQGANLILIGRRAEQLDSIFPGANPKQMKLAVDLLDADKTASALRRAERHFGAIDGLCATAGGFHMGEAAHETPADVWKRMHDLNVTTLLNAAGAIVPGMKARGGGRIVTVGANAAMKGVAKMGAYCAAKSAVMRISEAMAAELGSSGIAVNCVLPSIIDTPENRAAMPDSDRRGWVAPDDIAATIAFLLSAEATAINGALVPVTG